MSHINDLAEQHDHDANDERYADRATAYIPDNPRTPSYSSDDEDY